MKHTPEPSPDATPEALAVAAALQRYDIAARVEGGRIRIGDPDDPSSTLVDVRLDEPEPASRRPQIVVRDRITEAVRDQFLADGIGWLDGHGHMSFRTGSLIIETGLPVSSGYDLGLRIPAGSQRRILVLAGAVVSGVTMAALAAWPRPLGGVRATARLLDATPGGVSLAYKRLIEGGYLTSDHRATAELFWAAAYEWRPEWVELPVISLPPGTAAVAAVGSLAAAQLGAPVAVTAETAPEYLVGSPAILKYAAVSAQARSGTSGDIARYAVAPAPIAATTFHPARPSVRMVPIASEAIVALSLAIDPARGAESVRSWDGEHVWN